MIITSKQSRVMVAVLKQLGYAPLPEIDERGWYVYDMDTKEELFRADFDSGISLFNVFNEWCDERGIVPF